MNFEKLLHTFAFENTRTLQLPAPQEHQRKTRELTWAGRDFLQREFATLGLEFVPSHANFVLVKVGDGKAVFQALMKRGIIIRDMNAYGLPEWIRVSIGTMEQNERFLAELKRLPGFAPKSGVAVSA
jgi:histidinol-phosphate aminotransferase